MKHGKWLNEQTAAQVLAVLDAKLEEAKRAGNANLARKIEQQIEKIEGAGYVEAMR